MSFNFYTNIISKASRQVASVIFIIGMLLIGFGFLIYLLPRLFATLAALFFFLAGTACALTGIRIFAAQHKMDKLSKNGGDAYRQNVRIHVEEHHYQ
jgi:hypothetical protein